MHAKELEAQFKSGTLKTKGGTFWFCGAFIFGKPGDTYYQLKAVAYDDARGSLHLTTDIATLTIVNPGKIHETDRRGPHLVISTADKIIFQHRDHQFGQTTYTLAEGKALAIHSNGHQQEREVATTASILEFGE